MAARRQLTLADREEISRGLAEDESFVVIARRIGRDHTVISRDVARHGGRCAYRAARADRVAVVVALGSRVVEGAPGTPFTRTEFRTKKVLKGTLRRRFAVQVIGGRLHNTFVTPVVREFERSHRYLVFLGPDGPAGPTIFPDPIIEMKRGPP